jgi:hypothetical protein
MAPRRDDRTDNGSCVFAIRTVMRDDARSVEREPSSDGGADLPRRARNECELTGKSPFYRVTTTNVSACVPAA